VRELTSHKVNVLNEALKVRVMDEPGSGGACHQYLISTPNKPLRSELSSPAVNCEIEFQNGPIGEFGVNGISQEALLAILEDRLVGFQSGPYATADNAEALEHIRAAMECLHRRTKARVARGVEGTHAV
jgi:hypothetical protein